MRVTSALAFLVLVIAAPLTAQIQAGDPRMNDPHRSLNEPHFGGSSDVTVLSHIPSGPWSHVMDMEIEQELSRPYAYVARAD